MVSLLRGDDRGIRRQHEVDTRVRHQVRLKLGDVHVQRAVETQGSRETRDDLRDQAVQVRIRGALNVEVPWYST